MSDNEYAVIGSILIDPRCVVEIDRAGLSAEDFDVPIWRLAFEVVEDLRAAGKPLDPVLISAEMARRRPGTYDSNLQEAMLATTTAANMEAYCRLVKDGARRRKLSAALSDAITTVEFGDWREGAGNILEALQDFQNSERDVFDAATLSETFLHYYQETKEDPENAYCPTGFSDLDAQLGGGMFRSEVYIVGARPGMGKTTLGINIAQNIVNRGKAVLFVSLEMSEQQIQAKRLALETGIRYTSLMTGRISGDEEETMKDWLVESRGAPFYLTTRSITVGEIGRTARQVEGLACIIVDYIGLISCPEESRQKPRYEQMTEISAALKAMAKAMHVPVLALCQLNRENTTRSDKRPTMADLRDSGAIEQDAGAIILLHRPDYYATKESGETPDMEEIELNVAKNRHAEPGLVRMWWHGNVGKIMMKARAEDQTAAPVKTRINDEEALPF